MIAVDSVGGANYNIKVSVFTQERVGDVSTLRDAPFKVIGTKQTLKHLERGDAETVYVAGDAEERVIEPILRLAEDRGVPVIRMETMRELGRACGIEVGAATAAILKGGA